MVNTIADAVAQIQAVAAPVFLIDTCNFIDLFRVQNDDEQKLRRPRVLVQEINAAIELLDFAKSLPRRVHVVVPELIPREYQENSDRIQKDFDNWMKSQDEFQQWLFEAASFFPGGGLPVPTKIQPFGLAAKIRDLADQLLATATILGRDQACLERATTRLIDKRPPCQNKEMKDSMNIEQCLELSRRLGDSGFRLSRIWVSSNTRDFAERSSPKLHPDLVGEFSAAGLDYVTSFQAAIGRLRGKAEL